MSTDANARGTRASLGHVPGLDGVRALSVLAIIAFHTGLNSVPGGYYGVDAFFVLSGFLITSLLVKEWLFTTWRQWADAYSPAVVVYVARGETFDQEVGNRGRTWARCPSTISSRVGTGTR